MSCRKEILKQKWEKMLVEILVIVLYCQKKIKKIYSKKKKKKKKKKWSTEGEYDI